MTELVTSVASASKHGFVRYDGVHRVADRLRVGTAVLHCPSERFPVTEPVRCTMTPEGCRAVPLDSPADRLPIHYAEWTRFRQAERPRVSRPPPQWQAGNESLSRRGSALPGRRTLPGRAVV